MKTAKPGAAGAAAAIGSVLLPFAALLDLLVASPLIARLWRRWHATDAGRQ